MYEIKHDSSKKCIIFFYSHSASFLLHYKNINIYYRFLGVCVQFAFITEVAITSLERNSLKILFVGFSRDSLAEMEYSMHKGVLIRVQLSLTTNPFVFICLVRVLLYLNKEQVHLYWAQNKWIWRRK